MSVEETPRAYTLEEVADELIAHLRGVAHYWASTQLPTGRDSVKDRVEGAIFSALCALDGVAGLPAFEIIPAPHPDDKQYHIDDGENFYQPIEADTPASVLIERQSLGALGYLHDRFYADRKGAANGH